MIKKRIFCLPSALLLTACASEPEITEHAPLETLLPTDPISCVPYDQVSNKKAPPDIVAGVKLCISETQYVRAAKLLMVASSFAFFDTQRIKDPTAHYAWNAALAEILGDIQQADRVELYAQLDALNSDHQATSGVCQYLEQLSPPAYEPNYMLNHGLDAFQEKIDAAPPAEFEAQLSWEKARKYVKCRA